MSRYIQEETVYWLAGTGNPVVSYLVRRDFPGFFAGSALSSYEGMRSCPQVSRIADVPVLDHNGTLVGMADLKGLVASI